MHEVPLGFPQPGSARGSHAYFAIGYPGQWLMALQQALINQRLLSGLLGLFCTAAAKDVDLFLVRAVF